MADRIGEVSMAACFALMIAPEGGSALPFDGIECDHPVLRWASNEQSKPGRSSSLALVLQSTHDWADEHRDDDRGEVALALRRSAEETFGLRFGPSKVEAVHRWLFARTVQPLGEPVLIDQANRLASCGDWCLLGSIEGAFLSGDACSRAILDKTT